MNDYTKKFPQKLFYGRIKLFILTVRKSKINLELYRVKPEDLKDPDRELFYVKESFKHWNKHVTEYYITDISKVDYAIFLIKQVYEKFSE